MLLCETFGATQGELRLLVAADELYHLNFIRLVPARPALLLRLQVLGISLPMLDMFEARPVEDGDLAAALSGGDKIEAAVVRNRQFAHLFGSRKILIIKLCDFGVKNNSEYKSHPRKFEKFVISPTNLSHRNQQNSLKTTT